MWSDKEFKWVSRKLTNLYLCFLWDYSCLFHQRHLERMATIISQSAVVSCWNCSLSFCFYFISPSPSAFISLPSYSFFLFCVKNDCPSLVRVYLLTFRAHGKLYPRPPNCQLCPPVSTCRPPQTPHYPLSWAHTPPLDFLCLLHTLLRYTDQ